MRLGYGSYYNMLRSEQNDRYCVGSISKGNSGISFWSNRHCGFFTGVKLMQINNCSDDGLPPNRRWPKNWWARSCHIYASTIFSGLTHWGQGQMAAIFQTTFSNAFPWMKLYEFRLKFHWILFPGVQLTIFQHWFRNGLAPARRQAIIWADDGLFTDTYMRHSASMS